MNFTNHLSHMNRSNAMLRATALIVSMTTAHVASAAPGAFRACPDAFNHGHNTAQLYVSQSFKRLECDAGRLHATEETLARVMKRMVLRTSDPESIKICYYDGLYSGYVDALLAGYEACGSSGFGDIDPSSIVRAAEAVFVAMLGSLGPALTPDRVTTVFTIDDELATPDQDADVCANDFEDRVRADLDWSASLSVLVASAVAAVCES